VDITAQPEPSKEGRKRNKEAKKLVQDARANVVYPSNQRR